MRNETGYDRPVFVHRYVGNVTMTTTTTTVIVIIVDFSSPFGIIVSTIGSANACAREYACKNQPCIYTPQYVFSSSFDPYRTTLHAGFRSSKQSSIRKPVIITRIRVPRTADRITVATFRRRSRNINSFDDYYYYRRKR